MNKHWKYLKYVLRHKYFVFRAGLVTGAPLWRLVIHDWSKFCPAEWFPYTENFYGVSLADGSEDLRMRKQNFRYAFLHHIHRNPHHWEHWVLKEPQPMPVKFVREMVADWCGAGRAITGEWEVDKWYENNKGKIRLHPDTRALVESSLTSEALRSLK